MGWRDDPVVSQQQSAQPAWMADPVVSEQPAAPDQFAGDSLLSNESMSALDAGASSTVTPSPAPSPFRGAKRYLGGINDALGGVNRAQGSGILGSIEALATIGTGGIAAPILGTAESIALGTPPEESFARYTYQPRTESGKAQLGVLGAAVSPITESGTDIALGPLAAQTRVAGIPAKVAPNAARTNPGRSAVPGPGRQVAATSAPSKVVPPAAVQAKPAAGLEKVRAAAPSIDELSTQAKAAYKKAEDAGVVISKDSFAGLQKQIQKDVGRTADPTLHPDTSAALKRVLDEKGDVSLEKLDALRQIANDAKGSVKPADQRLASMIVEKIDDYVERIGAKDVVAGDASKASALKEARNLYSRKMKAQEIQQLIQRAEDSAPNFSASGLENALRTEFRALVKNPKRLRRFNAEEQAAIRKVARGGPVENTLRMIGKMAPTGAVSGLFGIASSALVPGGAALPIAGLASRYAATRMTRRNALAAEELMRRGPQNSIKQPAKKRNALIEY